VFWIFAIVLAIFGLVFVLLGQNSERNYWMQRDPSGNAREDATKLASIARRAGHYAAGEFRAPLRITAIGFLLIEVAIGFAIIALIATIAS
jgi:preprotein translocase subunit Sss1